MLKKPTAVQRAPTGKIPPVEVSLPHAFATPVAAPRPTAGSIASLYGLESVPEDGTTVIDLASPVDVDSSTEAENAITLLSPGLKPPMTVDKKRPRHESNPAESSGTTRPGAASDLVPAAEHADVASMAWIQVLSDGTVHKTPLQRGSSGFCEATTRSGLKVTLPTEIIT
eukprot:2934970-Amphidinium_carterae.1